LVSPKGVEAYEGAKAGFIQMAYGVQMPGLNPKAVDLDGTAADDAALSALAAQAPTVVFAVGAQAVKKVRKAMPEVWIVYGMVYFPESEGFLSDPKMVGVASLGPAKALAADIKTFTKSKSVVILHAQAESAAVSALVDRLRAEGLDPLAKGVPSSTDLPAAFDTVKESFKTVILLPDSITASPDSMRFLISQCVQGGILPVALAEPLVASGALLAAYYTPEAVGNQAARLAADLIKTGNTPSERLVTPAESATALNKSTAQALKINVPKNFRVEVTYE
jgi:ABC-type uncharacterized transport system substrate-binding protein